MAKGRRQLEGAFASLDLVIEVRDARAPRLTASPLLSSLGSVPIRTVLTKSDLADPDETEHWLAHLKEVTGRQAYALDLRSGDAASFRRLARDVAAFRPVTSAKRTYREVRTAVVGTPNVGKSMLINRLVGKRAAEVGGIPGVTRGVSWFRGEGLLVADSPGILDPHEDPRAHRMLSWLASTRGAVIGSWEGHATECLAYLARHGMASRLLAKWEIEPTDDAHETLCRIASRLGKINRGGTHDTEAAGKAFLEALGSGRIGRVTLESPGAEPSWNELT